MYLISPVNNCDNIGKVLSIRETCQSLGVKGFCWGLITKAHSACVTDALDPPRKKVGVQHKSHCLYKLSIQGRVVQGLQWAKPSYQLEHSKSTIPRIPQRAHQDNRHIWGMWKV